MSKYFAGDTKFTAQVKSLLSKVYGCSPLKDSVLERAIDYYQSAASTDHKLNKLNKDIDYLTTVVSTKVDAKQSKLERQRQEFVKQLRFESHERYQHLQQICRDIIELCEGENYAETLRKSAQFLGTIQLLSPTEGNKIAATNERHKPLYKAVLALRLLDEVCLQQLLPDTYITSELAKVSSNDVRALRGENPAAYQGFVDAVKIPVLMAALLQDIGNYHPDAQRIMHGADGKLDKFRTLSTTERKALLQINYRETLTYLLNGIGAGIYLGNCKTERSHFLAAENKKLTFIKRLLKSSINPKLGLGNLLKVPQIYSSIVLSTKASYNYKLLPKVYQALYQNAQRGTCSVAVVEALYQITGDFPQGYGVIYVPYEVDQELRYEYAIVNQLYPEKPNEPKCRMATRHLTFIGFGHDLIIHESHNLYFVATAQAFSTITKERLNEILALLASNYLERKELDLLPRCWHPGEYFASKVHQKLWIRDR
ncbi:hypothetical protein SAMN05216262_11019 [Colwellia chukchiensis]|uniref:Uncharacterized protein n=1 Tax=Colwellia chukchiensis TaxID=641665 RepID=A0A1H7PSA2_9GAMM|nr:hypothetical protein [Colwellia chukchiensis]SEL38466.1 hypothetical protein SAMN05216262_11019 [Colwellia chukchiensis]